MPTGATTAGRPKSGKLSLRASDHHPTQSARASTGPHTLDMATTPPPHQCHHLPRRRQGPTSHIWQPRPTRCGAAEPTRRSSRRLCLVGRPPPTPSQQKQATDHPEPAACRRRRPSTEKCQSTKMSGQEAVARRGRPPVCRGTPPTAGSSELRAAPFASRVTPHHEAATRERLRRRRPPSTVRD
jgi:hypothetical protein